MSRGARSGPDRNRPASRASTRRRRGPALIAEHLEDRSVPSGFGELSISSLTSAVQSTAALAQDLVTPSDLDGPAGAHSPSSTAPALSLGDTLATAIGGVLEPAESGLDRLSAALTPVVSPIDVAPGSRATDATSVVAAGPSPGVSIDMLGLISVNAGLPTVGSGAGGVGSGLAAAVGDVPHTLDGGAAGGGGSGGEGGSLSIGADPGLGGTGNSISDPGIASTLPRLSVDPTPSPSPPLDRNGASPAPSLPALATTPTPTVDAGGTPASPPSGDGSTSTSLSGQASLDTVVLPDASHATSAGSASGSPAPTDVGTAEAPAVALASGVGTVAAVGVAAQGAASSTTAPSLSATIPGPAAAAGNGLVVGQGRLEDAARVGDSSSAGAERPADPKVAPAELAPRDLESLERALGQLLRRVDRMGEDLAGWFTEIGMLEMLSAAGMVVLACEIVRRSEQRRRLAIPRARIGFSGRPGPFYRPMGDPSVRPGAGRRADVPAIV